MTVGLFRSAAAEPRIALVLTNQKYHQLEELTRTHADGDLIAAALRASGFDVTVVHDTRRPEDLRRAVMDHVGRLKAAGPDAVGFFYYSGHGAPDDPKGENYLLPTNAAISQSAQLSLAGVGLGEITKALGQSAAINFVVFDACRRLDLQRKVKGPSSSGHAPVSKQHGMLISFATEAGNVAEDNGIYAEELAKEITRETTRAKLGIMFGPAEASTVFLRVAASVRERTSQAQMPERIDNRLKEFYFASYQASTTAGSPKPRISAAGQQPGAPQPPRCVGIEATVGDGRLCLVPGSGQRNARFRDCDSCPWMMAVPAGRFLMGSPTSEVNRRSDVEDAVRVKIAKPFAVGRYAVTRAEFEAFTIANPKHAFLAGCELLTGSSWQRRTDRTWRFPGFAQSERHPVVCVSWYDAQAYVKWLSATTHKQYRLLSETEREYVTRASAATSLVAMMLASRPPFWWGPKISPDMANYDGDYVYAGGQKGEDRKSTVEVDVFRPNPWGVFNVHGNVYEWTEDCWNPSNKDNPGTGAARVATGECTERVVRGGNWFQVPSALRSAARLYQPADLPRNGTGFRVARDL